MAFGSIWKFGADNSEYKKAVREMPSELDKSARQIESRTKEMGARMSGAMRDITGILAGGMALAGLKSLMNDFDKVAKVATRFGASAEEIQRVSVAADLAGTSIDTVARVLTKLSVAASDASTGNKAMAEAFQRAGISAEQFKNSGLDQQLVLLSEAFNRARGNADATNQIIELMGTRAASQMIPLIDNTAALRAEMEGVSVASDDVVRKIEAANDRLTRLGNNIKVSFAGALEFFIEFNERIGSVLAQSDGLLRLFDGLAKATRGNILPLFEVLGTARTIQEMEQIEARASAIAQLTNEGLLTDDQTRNATLIAERTEQILKNLRGTTSQLVLSEDSTDRVLTLEKEKTGELERQQAALDRQEESRQKALRSLEKETALIEARLRGDKAAEASLLEQGDFESALERTGSFEAAANFAANRAAERRRKDAGTPGGALLELGEPAGPTRRERIAEMQGNARARRDDELAARYESAGFFGSAVSAQDRALRRRDEAMTQARMKDMFKSEFDAGNLGEAFSKYKSDTPLGNRLTEEQFKKFYEDMAQTPEQRQRKQMERDAAQKKAPTPQESPVEAILSVIKKHLPAIDDKLPQHALV
jgi:hypothetical protein